MDKNTLSHYGWIVILMLIFAVLIGTSSPLASYVKGSVENSINTTEEAIVGDVMDKLIEQYYDLPLYPEEETVEN